VIVCVGDSITYGVTRAMRGRPSENDPLGGYPGRAQVELGDRARVRNRGVGASVTRFWLTDPRDVPGRALWDMLGRLGWQGFDAPAPPAEASSILGGVLALDRPDVVVILIGVNDLEREHPPDGDVVAATATNIEDLYRRAKLAAPAVLVATVLPNRRDPPALLAALNARIRAAHPDYLPLGERFAAAGWEQLLGDEIHPNTAGYAVLATALVDELQARRLVPQGAPPSG
jgi:lysophospholipase L1-like esterase